jgi:hypothetical protein
MRGCNRETITDDASLWRRLGEELTTPLTALKRALGARTRAACPSPLAPRRSD